MEPGQALFLNKRLFIQYVKQGCNDMKSTILLSTALFLASAPSPDSKAISEISAGFLVITENIGLMASEAESSTETKIDVLRNQEDS